MSAPAAPGTTIEPPDEVTGQALVDLRQQLSRGLRHHGDLVVDCRHVRTLSPAAQALLVAAARMIRFRGHRLVLTHPTAAVARALRTTGLSHLLARPARAP